MLTKLKDRVRRLKGETYTLYLAARHPRTPWYARFFIAAVVAYAFSPIDLIPDVIPILGVLDDLVLIPLGLVLAIKMIPPGVWSECRIQAQKTLVDRRPVSRVAGGVIICIWLALLGLGMRWAFPEPWTWNSFWDFWRHWAAQLMVWVQGSSF